jgi:anaerobic selenocysteine-containing dehydrogenase
MDVELVADVRELEGKRGTELHKLGRLPYPMLRRRGEAAFERVHKDDAHDLVSRRLRARAPERLNVYMTSRGEPNENYYAAQKAARALGTDGRGGNSAAVG